VQFAEPGEYVLVNEIDFEERRPCAGTIAAGRVIAGGQRRSEADADKG
jgi:hypothetical protein